MALDRRHWCHFAEVAVSMTSDVRVCMRELLQKILAAGAGETLTMVPWPRACLAAVW